MNNDHLPIYKSSKWLIWNNNFTLTGLISYLFTSHPCTLITDQVGILRHFFGGWGFGNDQLDPILTVKLPHVHQQKGITDWGLFAIAFAVHLAFGDDVSKLTCDQSQMSRRKKCSHSHSPASPELCFPFREIELFCSCQMSETCSDMIACNKCGDWYHMEWACV